MCQKDKESQSFYEQLVGNLGDIFAILFWCQNEMFVFGMF